MLHIIETFIITIKNRPLFGSLDGITAKATIAKYIFLSQCYAAHGIALNARLYLP
jgi:hypothetical protein